MRRSIEGERGKKVIDILMELDLADKKVANLCDETRLVVESKVHKQRRLQVLKALAKPIDNPTVLIQRANVCYYLACTCSNLEQEEEASNFSNRHSRWQRKTAPNT